MLLSSVLELNKDKSIISIAGGGGKTTTLFTLASELKEYKVLITTTTKILKPKESNDYEIITDLDSREFLDYLKNKSHKNIIVYGHTPSIESRKLEGCTFSFLKAVKRYFDVMIIESDGSAGRPIKAPAAHEPVIFENTDTYIGVIGLDCLGKPATDIFVHRPELFSKIRNKNQNEIIATDDLVKLINSKDGLFKDAPENCRKIALLNKGDLLTLNECEILADTIIKESKFPLKLIINSYREKKSVLISKESTVFLD